jgi:hypothetical protein
MILGYNGPERNKRHCGSKYGVEGQVPMDTQDKYGVEGQVPMDTQDEYGVEGQVL